MPARWRTIPAGLLGGVVGNGVLGVLFSSPPVRRVLYDPALQSRLFIDVTPIRNIPLSVGGLVVLSIAHAWLFSVFSPSVPGRTWLRKGLFWGLTIWLMYWVFQEWFIYHTLLGEPWFLNLLELLLLLVGSLAEGMVISGILRDKSPVARHGTDLRQEIGEGLPFKEHQIAEKGEADGARPDRAGLPSNNR